MSERSLTMSRSNSAQFDGSTAPRAIPPVGNADEIYQHAFDEINACRRRISAILARSPMLRMSDDEDKPLPAFDLWVVAHKGQIAVSHEQQALAELIAEQEQECL